MSFAASALLMMLTPFCPPAEAPAPVALCQVTAPVATDSPHPVAPVVPAPEPPAIASRTDETVPASSQTLQPIAPADDIVVVARPRGDPLRVVNARSFAATQAVDEAITGPAALTYKRIVPDPVRSGLRNFLNNLHEPNVALNYLLQLKPGKAAETVGRFALNTTIGIAGLFDIAKRRPFRLPRRPNGFADTLGYYGVRPGAFVFLPLIGPTTVRDLIGGGVDRLLTVSFVHGPIGGRTYILSTGVVRVLDRRAETDGRARAIRASADPYESRRAFYMSKRQDEIDHLRGHRPDSRPVILQPLPQNDFEAPITEDHPVTDASSEAGKATLPPAPVPF